MKYLCRRCNILNIDENDLINGNCPGCGESVEHQCELDRICHCAETHQATTKYCPLCGKAVCPTCGCHDVVQISRVTGYLADVAGWSEGKRQELKDRTRYNIDGSIDGEIR